MVSFYIDSCIYLNLWQKEESRDMQYWKVAKDFLEKFDNNNNTIYYSGFLLKEMNFILGDSIFNEKRKLFNETSFKKIFISTEELNIARKIESELNFEISFFDIIHVVLSKKTNSILITRDKKLLDTAKNYSVIAKKPEELL